MNSNKLDYRILHLEKIVASLLNKGDHNPNTLITTHFECRFCDVGWFISSVFKQEISQCSCGSISNALCD